MATPTNMLSQGACHFTTICTSPTYFSIVTGTPPGGVNTGTNPCVATVQFRVHQGAIHVMDALAYVQNPNDPSPSVIDNNITKFFLVQGRDIIVLSPNQQEHEKIYRKTYAYVGPDGTNRLDHLFADIVHNAHQSHCILDFTLSTVPTINIVATDFSNLFHKELLKHFPSKH